MSLERSTTGAARLFRPAGALVSGRDPVVLWPEEAGWTYAALHVLTLAPGEARTVRTEGFEAAVLPLSGACEVRVEGSTFTLQGRADVFSRVTDVAYLPVGVEAVLASAGGVEVALPMAPPSGGSSLGTSRPRRSGSRSGAPASPRVRSPTSCRPTPSRPTG